jgi:hypothetical protein
MIKDLFNKNSEWPRHFRRIINDLRKQSLEEGIDPLDFPAWLKQQGIEANGPFIHVDDSLVTFSELKYTK